MLLASASPPILRDVLLGTFFECGKFSDTCLHLGFFPGRPLHLNNVDSGTHLVPSRIPFDPETLFEENIF